MIAQSKRESVIESLVGTLIGFCASFATQAAVYPLYGLSVSVNANLQITAIFTLVSIARSYAVRRCFNHMISGGK